MGLNINHKSSGVQNILLEGCTFTDCALPAVSADKGTTTYGAPVRIVAREGATTHLTVNGTTFNYSDGKTNCGNGDILLGDGRHDAALQQGTVTLAMTGTAAQVMVQQAGYYDNAGTVADAAKAKVTPVTASDEVQADPDNHFVVKRDPVVQIGETGYGTLEEAMEAAKAMTGDVTVTVLKDIQVTASTYDLSGTGLTSLTLQGKTGAEKLISGVDGNDIDGPIYCPVIRVKLPQNAGLTVNSLVFPDDLLFDSQDGRVLVKNCTFNGAQSGYPQAAAIRYEGNLFKFEGTAGNFYSQNAYPVWYKVDKPLDFDFVGNTVIGYRGVHIETRGDDAVAADIQVDKNTFRLSDSQNPRKAVALQLVSNIRGNVSFVDNNVSGYMGVCFYNGVKIGENATITLDNNYLAPGTKLYGVSEWNAPNGDVKAAEEKLQEQLKGKATIDATHTHTYQNGKCTVCGAQEPRPDPKPDAPAATPAPAPVLDSTPKTGAVSLVALPLAALALAGVGVALRKRRRCSIPFAKTREGPPAGRPLAFCFFQNHPEKEPFYAFRSLQAQSLPFAPSARRVLWRGAAAVPCVWRPAAAPGPGRRPAPAALPARLLRLFRLFPRRLRRPLGAERGGRAEHLRPLLRAEPGHDRLALHRGHRHQLPGGAHPRRQRKIPAPGL